MSSAATIYRKEHPEYYKQERIKNDERVEFYMIITQNTKKRSNNKH